MIKSERGISVILVAGSLLMLMGAAAIAVDVSGFYQQATSQERAADLGCLAGAWELPEDPVRAVETAASFIRPNHPELLSLVPSPAPTPAGNVYTYSNGSHIVTIETPFAGTASKMRVEISQIEPTTFGKAIGFNDVTILEHAVCEVGSALGAGADKPFGALVGFSGGIINYEGKKCVLNGVSSSQCSGLALPRHNDPAGSQFQVQIGNNYIANMVSGINWDLGCDTPVTDPMNPPGPKVPWCSVNDVPCPLNGTPTAADPEPCNRVATISGSDPNRVYQGMISGFSASPYPPESNIGYLENFHGGDTGLLARMSDYYDSHEMGDILECDTNGDGTGSGGECPSTDTTVFPLVPVTRVTDCKCPRIIRIPIVQSFPTSSSVACVTSDPDTWNDCSARIVGFESLWLLRPYYNGTMDTNGDGTVDSNDLDDFESSGQQVKTIAAIRVDFSNAVVEGDCFSAYKDGAPKKVRLIAG